MSTENDNQSPAEADQKEQQLEEKQWPTRLQNGELPRGYYLELWNTRILSENEIEYNVTPQYDEPKDENILLLSSTRTYHHSPSIVKVIPRSILSRYENLKHLELMHVGLERLTEGMFECVPNLKNIELTFNKLTELKAGTFSGCSKLQKLCLSNNEISHLDDDAFVGCENLQCLTLNENKISNIASRHLRPFRRSLNFLYITHNLIETLDPNLCDEMAELCGVRLGSNKIKNLPHAFLKNVPKLHSIDLDHNLIEEIDPEFLNAPVKLGEINLSYNRISKISPETFKHQSELQYIKLRHNEIEHLDPDTFSPLTSALLIDLRFNKLTEIHENLLKHTGSIYGLTLRGNRIKRIHPRAFDSLTEVCSLSLGQNCIEELPADLFANMKSLRSLLLDENQISELPPGIFKPLEGKQASLNLTGNNIERFERKTFEGLHKLRDFGFRDNPGSHMIDEEFVKIFAKGRQLLKFKYSVYTLDYNEYMQGLMIEPKPQSVVDDDEEYFFNLFD